MIKIYNSGSEFLAENADILKKYPLETVFFGLNSTLISQTNNNDFLVRLDNNGKFLIAVHFSNFPMVIFGNNDLCDEFARFAVNQGLTFNKVLGALDTCEAFLDEYGKITGCTHSINHAMDIMRCEKPDTADVDGVEWATERDVDELAYYAMMFHNEAMGESCSLEECKQKISGRVGDFAVIHKDGKIISFASKSRETEHLTAISYVYTLPQYRNMGLSCKVVTFLTKCITDSGRLAYLFVDKANPISNHLYNKIGYTYATPQYEIKIIQGK